MFLGIEQQKFEQLNELNDSDYSISDSTDENDSDSSIQPKENSTQISLRKSTRKKEIPFVGHVLLFHFSIFIYLSVYVCLDV